MKRLDYLYENAKEVKFDDEHNIVFISDIHRGDGTYYDSLLPNKNIYKTALGYNYKRGFTNVEVGDGDEIWKNRNVNDIAYTYSDIFKLLNKFKDDNRIYLIYGNHDIIKRSPKYLSATCTSYFDEGKKETVSLFPNLKVHEGLVLKHKQSGHKLFLIHGHQVDFLNHTIWKLARFLVRYVWKPLE